MRQCSSDETMLTQVHLNDGFQNKHLPAGTVTSLYTDRTGYQEKCPYIEVSLL